MCVSINLHCVATLTEIPSPTSFHGSTTTDLSLQFYEDEPGIRYAQVKFVYK